MCLRSANTRRVSTEELGLHCRLVANPYDLALIESLALAIKFLFRNSAAYKILLPESILPLHQKLSKWMSVRADALENNTPRK